MYYERKLIAMLISAANVSEGPFESTTDIELETKCEGESSTPKDKNEN